MSNRQNPEFIVRLNDTEEAFGRSGRLFVNANPEDVFLVEIERRGNFRVFDNNTNPSNGNINFFIGEDSNNNGIFDDDDRILSEVFSNEFQSGTVFFEGTVNPGSYFIELRDDGLTGPFGIDATSAYSWTATYSPNNTLLPPTEPNLRPDPTSVDLLSFGSNSDVVARAVGSLVPSNSIIHKVYRVDIQENGSLAVVNTGAPIEPFLSNTIIPPEGSTIALNNQATATPTRGVSFTLASDANNNGVLDNNDLFHDFENRDFNTAGTVIFNKSVTPGTYFVEVRDTNGSSSSLDRLIIFNDPGGSGAPLEIIEDPLGDDNLYGADGNDYLVGNSGDNNLYGVDGNDTLIGSNPNVYGSGSGEYDILNGGSGADTFVLGESDEAYYQGSGYATISDFDYSEGDKIQVYGSADDYTLSRHNNGVNINYYGDLIGHVENTTNVIISADFIFV